MQTLQSVDGTKCRRYKVQTLQTVDAINCRRHKVQTLQNVALKSVDAKIVSTKTVYVDSKSVDGKSADYRIIHAMNLDAESLDANCVYLARPQSFENLRAQSDHFFPKTYLLQCHLCSHNRNARYAPEKRLNPDSITVHFISSF